MCLYPVTIKTVDGFGLPVSQTVPCGKCIECLKDRQNSWKIRLTEEARDHKYVYFFTLTYRDDTVPYSFDEDGNRFNHFRKSDLQLWIKRNRISYQRYFKRDIDFKYFICAEYGPNTGRPHYHGILFTDISPTFISSMFNEWSVDYGFTNFSEVGVSGKKKVVYLPSGIMLLSTVLSHLVSKPMSNFVLTNLPRLEYFRRRST